MVKNLTEGAPLPLLFFFSMPMVVGNLFQQLYNMVDTAVVGKFVGEDAVAAVGSSFPIVFLSVAIAAGLSMGCNVACPAVPGKQVLNWGLEDPTGSGDEAFLKVIREIETNIKKLREQL